MDEGDLADIVAAFYDGAASPELWPAAGERLRRLLNAQVGVSRVGPVQLGLGELLLSRAHAVEPSAILRVLSRDRPILGGGAGADPK